MVMRVHVVDGEWRVVLPPEAVLALKLEDGGEIKVLPVDGKSTARYVTVDEAMQSYFETEPLHREAYQELAK